MRKPLTAAQIEARDKRREGFKLLLKQLANIGPGERIALSNKYGIRNPEGRELSPVNQILIVMQCPSASIVGGFRQWLDKGRCVKKGEHGICIWVPTGGAKASPDAGSLVPANVDDTRFIMGTVFDISQTRDVNETADPESDTLALVPSQGLALMAA